MQNIFNYTFMSEFNSKLSVGTYIQLYPLYFVWRLKDQFSLLIGRQQGVIITSLSVDRTAQVRVH